MFLWESTELFLPVQIVAGGPARCFRHLPKGFQPCTWLEDLVSCVVASKPIAHGNVSNWGPQNGFGFLFDFP